MIPTDTIKFFRPLTDEDRARIADKYGVDVSERQIQITFNSGTQKTYSEDLDAIRGQGIGLVNVGNNRHVIAQDIEQAEPFTKADAKAATDRGYTLNGTFRSRVELAGGRAVLSSAHPSQIMQRRAKAITSAAAASDAPKAQVS